MTRIPGNPGPLRWLWFAAGFRLPQRYADWVRHELTDAGWRWRTVLRNLAIIVPVSLIVIVVLFSVLPAPTWLAVMMLALILTGSVFTTAAYADDLRVSRLRQHGLEPPDDPDLGHPSHLLRPAARRCYNSLKPLSTDVPVQARKGRILRKWDLAGRCRPRRASRAALRAAPSALASLVALAIAGAAPPAAAAPGQSAATAWPRAAMPAKAGTACARPVIPPAGPFSIQPDHRTVADSSARPFISYGLTVPGLSSPTFATDKNFVTTIVTNKDLPKIDAAASAWCANTIRIQVSQFDVTNGTICHPAFLAQALDAEVRRGEADGLVVVINDQTESDLASRVEAGPTKATLAFWNCVARHIESWPGGVAYGHDPRVIFDVFNEPRADYCYLGVRPPNLGLWRDGGTFTGCGQVKVAYLGMNTVVQYLRTTAGARNLLWVEGPYYADTLAGLKTATKSYLIGDPLNLVVYSIHHPMVSAAAPPTTATWWTEFGYLVDHPAASGIAPVVVGEWTNFTAVTANYPYCLPNAPVTVPAFLGYLATIGVGLNAYQLSAGTLLKSAGPPWTNTTNYTDAPWKPGYCRYTKGARPPLLGAGQAVLTWFRAQN